MIVMDIFTTFPIWNGSSKQIKMMDSNDKSVGFIQRKFKNLFHQCMHYLPLKPSFLETIHLDAEEKGQRLQIREQPFKANLTQLNWDVSFKDTQSRLEDETKISTNPRMAYFKNEQKYLFKKDPFNRTCKVFRQQKICATIRVEKKIPYSLRTTIQTDELSAIEIFGIYYIIS